jgi:hypothetical protein
MGSGEDWLMQPVLEGLCKYESLIDGTLDLYDIARMNDAIEVRDENTRRLNLALAKER